MEAPNFLRKVFSSPEISLSPDEKKAEGEKPLKKAPLFTEGAEDGKLVIICLILGESAWKNF